MNEEPLLVIPEKNKLPVDPVFKRKTQKKLVLNLAGNIVLVFTAVFCTFGALISAFSFPINQSLLFFVWLFFAAGITFIITRFGSKGLLISFAAVLFLSLFFIGGITEGARWVIHEITSYYNNWLSVTVLFPGSEEFIDSAIIFIAFAGFIIILLLNISICIRRSVFITIAVTAPIVFLTFVITDSISDLIYLFGLIAVYLTLLLSSIISPHRFDKRSAVLFPALAIAVVIMTIVYIIAPYGSYSREEQIAVLGNRFRAIASSFGRLSSLLQRPGTGYGWLMTTDGGLTWQFNTDVVNVADAGNRTMSTNNLIEIRSSVPGTFYLRGYSMWNFSGRSWSNADISFYRDDVLARDMPALIAEAGSRMFLNIDPQVVEMVIKRTGDITPGVSYTPYYTATYLTTHFDYSSSTLSDSSMESFFYIDGSVHEIAEYLRAYNIILTIDEYGSIHNSIIGDHHYIDILNDDNIDNSYPLRVFTGNADEFPWFSGNETLLYERGILSSYSNYINQLGLYRDVDGVTAHRLRQIATRAGIDPSAERTVVADAVAGFIKSSGTYSLNPGIIPEDENFAVYFLTTLQEGYCIHFATAAVLMLRSLDIPARFTSGYVVTVSPGEVGRTVILTERNAHAWVEVFYDDVGWLALEVTPSGGNSPAPAFRPHSPVTNTPQPQMPPVTTPDLGDYQNGYETPDLTPGLSGTGGGGTSSVQTGTSIHPVLFNLLVALTIVMIIVISMPARRFIAMFIRKRRFRQEDTNKAVLYAWKYIQKLGKKELVPPGDIEELALKARFSQHKLTEDERRDVIRYSEKIAFEIWSGKEDVGRFWLRYIRALC